MDTMNKLAIGLGVVIVAGIAAAPYVSGMMIEKRMQSVSALPGLSDGITWSLDSYQRGYLSSTATSHVTVAGADGTRYLIHFKHTINQIPGVDGRYATIQTVWVPDAEIKPQVEQLFSGKEPVVLNTALSVFGGAHTEGDFAPINQPQVTFSGGTMTIDAAASGKFAYTGAFNSLNITGQKDDKGMPQSAAFKGITLDADGVMDKKSHIAWNSQFAMKVASLTVGNEGALSGLALTSHSLRTGDDFAVDVGLDVANADFSAAPSAFRTMKDLKFKYGISRVDAPALEDIVKQAQLAQKQTMGDPDKIKQAVSMSVMTHLPALLNAGPKFEIDPISFKLPDGTVALHFSAELPPGHGKEGMSNPMSLLNLLDMKGDFSLPEAVYQAAQTEAGPDRQAVNEQQLQQMVQKGYITQSNGMLSTNFAFKAGQLTINGLPANDLLGVMAAMSAR
jgi:uncharacterized protein YdgA (DUF945 family)